jgi:polar amino acid transport system substrate-binding protein
MDRKKLFLTILILFILLVISACQPTEETPEATPDTPPVEESPQPPVANKLDEIIERGTIIISTDPAYPPQSEVVAGAQRDPNTRCAADQRTANEFTGFDIDTAVEIANRLGLEPCFVTPDWGIITSGNWADRWDISIGSMTITPERMQNLYFTQPYYTTPAAFFVHEDNTTYVQPGDLSGTRLGACSGCTYDFYIDGTLSIPGEQIEFVVHDAVFSGYDTDLTALQDLALGDGVRLDAVLTAHPTGLEAIDAGLPIKQLGEPVYFEYLAGAVDKFHRADPIPLVERLTEIILQMHADGTLLQLSQQYYGVDLTSAAGEFDVGMLNQWP